MKRRPGTMFRSFKHRTPSLNLRVHLDFGVGDVIMSMSHPPRLCLYA
jgi:hypothetical protein